MFAGSLRFVRRGGGYFPLTPHLAGGFDDELQLGRLLRNRECVAFGRGRINRASAFASTKRFAARPAPFESYELDFGV
jgi:hypothetical protein